MKITSIRKNYRVISLILLYVVFILAYLLFIALNLASTPLFILLVIGSVAVLSTSTFYTVIHHAEMLDERDYESKIIPKVNQFKKKSIKMEQSDVIEEYLEALPAVEEYVDSDISYKDNPVIDKLIFNQFTANELQKINLLSLSKMEKMLFIREMLYFSPEERKTLIENMLKSRDKKGEDVLYSSPLVTVGMEDQVRTHVISLLEPGERMKILIVNTSDDIRAIKEKIGVLFDYKLENFVLSSGGIILHEDLKVKDYSLDDDDEIVIIPSRK